MNNRSFVWIGAGVLLLAVLLAVGAAQIKGAAGYAGAGPNFLPWVVSAAMAALGICLIVGARRAHEAWVETPAFPPSWKAVAWISAGLLLNAVLIEHVGFIASCAILFTLAARGFRVGEGITRPTTVMLVRDFAIGAAISAPVFWLFTKLLGVTLPSIMPGGWF
jgi:putative tricarboxylic transport membrane protein